MSLAQHLVLRGLIAKFWKEPYKNDLVRWGTDIHDRWMLPHFCETDFRDVIRDLRESGYPFEFDWFAPHFEFRFPRIGDLEQRDIQLELRTALEPWHVLGEEPGGGGTVRYVDSSLERLQVKARGLGRRPFRHHVSTAIACRCIRPARTAKAWPACATAPGSRRGVCSRPSRSHAPLRIRSLWTLGTNAARRLHLSRRASGRTQLRHVSGQQLRGRVAPACRGFSGTAITPGKFTPPPRNLNPDFPFTLDLRNV